MPRWEKCGEITVHRRSCDNPRPMGEDCTCGPRVKSVYRTGSSIRQSRRKAPKVTFWGHLLSCARTLRLPV